MISRRKTAVVFAAASMMAGCTIFDIIPDGEPPKGNVLNNQFSSEDICIRQTEAADFFISALVLALLENCPGEEVAIAGDSTPEHFAGAVLIRCGAITGNTPAVGKAQWVLSSSHSADILQMTLSHHDEIIWSQSVRII